MALVGNTFGIKTAPILNRSQRRQIILIGVTYAILGSLLVFLVIAAFYVIFGNKVQPIFEPFSIVIALWVFGAIIWVPALLISWPVMNAALINGRAGIVVAIGWGAALGGCAMSILDWQNALPMAVLGALFGTVFSGLNWLGTSCAQQKPIAQALSESD